MAERTISVRVVIDTISEAAGSKLGAFGKIAGAAALGTTALVAGGVVAAEKVAELGNEAFVANHRIENITKSMGLYGDQAGEVAKRLEEVAAQTALQTGLDENSIKATEAKLLTFKELAKTADDLGGNFDRATQAAIDLAAAGFGTMETDATQLGKALQDPATGLTSLRREGVTFTAAQTDVIKKLEETNHLGAAQTLILKAIETQVGGTAAATASGWSRMKNSFKLAAEELAGKAQPALNRFGNWVVNVGEPGSARLARNVGDKLAPDLARLGGFIENKVIPAAVQFDHWFLERILPGLEKTGIPILHGFEKGWDRIASSLQKNDPQLHVLGKDLERVAEILANDVLPVMGKFDGKGLQAFGTAVGVYITFLSKMITFWTAVFNIIGKVTAAVQGVAHAIENLPSLPSGLGGLVGHVVGRTFGGTSGRVAAGDLVVNFNGLVTDPQAAAREVSKVLQRHTVYLGSAA